MCTIPRDCRFGTKAVTAIDTPDALFTSAATTFAERSPALFAICGKHDRFTFVNAAWTRLLGWSARELLARPFLDFVVDDDRARTRDVVRRYEEGTGPAAFVNRYRHVDGSTRTLLWNASFDPRADALYGVATDITERDAAEARQAALIAVLERRSAQLTLLLELGRFAGGGAPLARVLVTAVNALAHGLGTSHAALYLGTPGELAFAAGSGYESHAVPGDRLIENAASQVGRTIEACVPFASGPAPLARTPLQARAGIEASLTVPLLRTGGIGVLCADDAATRRFDIDDIAFAEACAALVAFVVVRESGEPIRALRTRRNVVVPTRDAFARLLDARGEREANHVVFAIDGAAALDDEALFAVIESTLTGAFVGRDAARPLLVAAPAGDEAACAAAERLRDALAEAFGTRACAIGVARIPADAASAAEAIAAAELALTAAAQPGRRGLAAYDPTMTAAAHRGRALRADLPRAIENDEFFLVFQPIVDARRGTVVALEALVRWDHPQAGIIPPNEFIGIAEETGDIVALTRRVLHEATKECRRWQRFAHDAVSVAVNVSAIDLADPAFIDNVTHALRSASLPARYLTIEVTESVLMHDVERASRTLEALRSFGATTALDDFGTGYSSLAYLKRLPFDSLKIDRAFVRDIATNEHDLALVDAITAVAEKFGMRATAEGVETPEQAQILRALGCDTLQGYLFARPTARAALEALLRRPTLLGMAEDADGHGHSRAS